MSKKKVSALVRAEIPQQVSVWSFMILRGWPTDWLVVSWLFPLAHYQIRIFVFEWNFSATVEWIVLDLVQISVHGLWGMSPNDWWPTDFYPSVTGKSNIQLSSETFQHLLVKLISFTLGLTLAVMSEVKFVYIFVLCFGFLFLSCHSIHPKWARRQEALKEHGGQ